MTLKSVEMPYRLLTTRNSNIEFNITFSYGSFNNAIITIDMAERQYTNIDIILTRINSYINDNIS